MNSEPKCCGCGAPYALGEYQTCDCATGLGYFDDSPEIVQAKPPCAQCGTIPIRAVLDGDPLCQSCCTKWAQSEGAAINEHHREALEAIASGDTIAFDDDLQRQVVVPLDADEMSGIAQAALGVGAQTLVAKEPPNA